MKKILRFIRRNILWLTFLMSALCLLLSFFGQNRFSDFSSAASSLQGALQQRESLLDDYAFKALDIPEDEWIELKDLPEDMVIYRYRSETLQSWAHQFPFAND